MPLKDEKSKIFADISALKVMTSTRKRQGNHLWSSINQVSKNPIDFLSDLIKELAGYEALRETFVQSITTNLDVIEVKVKNAIKTSIKDSLGCSVNPAIPLDLRYDGVGYNINLKDVDIFKLFKINPLSNYGNLFYEDSANQINSTDFNTFLYYTIQDKENINYWSQQQGSEDILGVTFFQNFNGENNIINIKASEYYCNNKSLYDWYNDYIDSVRLLPTGQFFSDIIDSIFSLTTNIIKKSPEQLETEEKLNEIINRILNSDSEEPIDDSYFTFGDSDMANITDRIYNRSNKIKPLESCYRYASEINLDLILEVVNDIKTGATENKINIINNAINRIGDNYSDTSDVKDKYNIKLKFLVDLINALVKSITTKLFSPKIIWMFLINYRIITNNDIKINGVEELIQFFKKTIKEIINAILGVITYFLLQLVLKKIKELQVEVVENISTELIKNKKKQLMSFNQ